MQMPAELQHHCIMHLKKYLASVNYISVTQVFLGRSAAFCSRHRPGRRRKPLLLFKTCPPKYSLQKWPFEICGSSSAVCDASHMSRVKPGSWFRYSMTMKTPHLNNDDCKTNSILFTYCNRSASEQNTLLWIIVKLPKLHLWKWSNVASQ